jgi:uncharacterized sporulation protein YeaH/YhbH (DUF444 family)
MEFDRQKLPASIEVAEQAIRHYQRSATVARGRYADAEAAAQCVSNLESKLCAQMRANQQLRAQIQSANKDFRVHIGGRI